MTPSIARIETLNVHAERSLLAPEQLARWRGLPLGWFDAGPVVHHRNFLVPHALLALLDTGSAEAVFDFGGGPHCYEFAAGALRVFDGRQACRRNDWLCRGARRIIVDLDAMPWGGTEVLDGLQQDLHVHDEGLARLLRAMVHEVADGCPQGALYAETLSAGLLLRLARVQGRERRERRLLTAAQLRRVDDCIAAAAGASPSLAELAAAAGLSRAQFVRLFRRSTGRSPHRYVLERRLERARDLVLHSHQPLADVASELGFSSQSHLSGAFQRAFGCAPGQARRQSE